MCSNWFDFLIWSSAGFLLLELRSTTWDQQTEGTLLCQFRLLKAQFCWIREDQWGLSISLSEMMTAGFQVPKKGDFSQLSSWTQALGIPANTLGAHRGIHSGQHTAKPCSNPALCQVHEATCLALFPTLTSRVEAQESSGSLPTLGGGSVLCPASF